MTKDHFFIVVRWLRGRLRVLFCFREVCRGRNRGWDTWLFLLLVWACNLFSRGSLLLCWYLWDSVWVPIWPCCIVSWSGWTNLLLWLFPPYCFLVFFWVWWAAFIFFQAQWFRIIWVRSDTLKWFFIFLVLFRGCCFLIWRWVHCRC